MSLKTAIRAMQAAEKQQQRDARNRQRELERRAKELAKLSALDQARLEVETHENALEVLLSVHKEQADRIDWFALAASLPPVPPLRHSHNEFKARRCLAVAPPLLADEAAILQARQQDEREYEEALQRHATDDAEWEKVSSLARRVLHGDQDAYVEAIEEFGPFAEIAAIGSSVHFTIHDPRLLEALVNTDGRKAIPSEVKSLTALGKVSVKAMPRVRFVEIYQDYVCGCVLRVARELFALLPIDTLLITASAESLDTSTGQTVERPILSVAISRASLNALNFHRLDPSDTVLSLPHRGDLRASRKTGDFEFIVPMMVSDIPHDISEAADFGAVVASARRLREDLAAACAALDRKSVSIPASGETR